MPILPVLTETGELKENANSTLIGAMCYPECVASIEIFRVASLLQDDEQIDHSIVNLINRDMKARSMSGYVTGLVAGFLLHQSASGLQPSMNKAVFLTLKFCADKRFKSPLMGENFFSSSIRSDSGVRKAFRSLQTVAHFWLASDAFHDAFQRIGNSSKDLEFFLELSRLTRELLSGLPHFDSASLMDIPPTSLQGRYRVKVLDVRSDLSKKLEEYISVLR